MSELYILESGVRRKAEWKRCLCCKQKFLERLNKSRPKKYCSVECRGKSIQDKVQVSCATCTEKFDVTKSRKTASKSGFLFCSMKCKIQAQKIGSNIALSALPSHYGTGERNSDVYRRVYKESNKIHSLICERCGYFEFECGIDIHHIDKNKKNNDHQNLLALCSPCHRALHCNLWLVDEIKGD